MKKFLYRLFKRAKLVRTETPEGFININIRESRYKTEWYSIPHEIMQRESEGKAILVGEIDNQMVLIIDVKAGVSYEPHMHLDASEHIQIISGKLYDVFSGKTLVAGDSLYIPAGQLHEFHMLEDTIHQTTFTLI